MEARYASRGGVGFEGFVILALATGFLFLAGHISAETMWSHGLFAF